MVARLREDFERSFPSYFVVLIYREFLMLLKFNREKWLFEPLFEGSKFWFADFFQIMFPDIVWRYKPIQNKLLSILKQYWSHTSKTGTKSVQGPLKKCTEIFQNRWKSLHFTWSFQLLTSLDCEICVSEMSYTPQKIRLAPDWKRALELVAKRQAPSASWIWS